MISSVSYSKFVPRSFTIAASMASERPASSAPQIARLMLRSVISRASRRPAGASAASSTRRRQRLTIGIVLRNRSGPLRS